MAHDLLVKTINRCTVYEEDKGSCVHDYHLWDNHREEKGVIHLVMMNCVPIIVSTYSECPFTSSKSSAPKAYVSESSKDPRW